MKIGYKKLLEQAQAEIETIPAEEAKGYLGHVFVDLRYICELQREGKIPGAFHAPRGMLEFWVDPESPYHCAGGWRSALAAQTVQRMGLEPVCHIEGGFKAWLEAGGAVEFLGGDKR